MFEIVTDSAQHAIFQDLFFDTLECSQNEAILALSNSQIAKVKLGTWKDHDGPCIVYNTEQLSRPLWLGVQKKCIENPEVLQYWDYSQYNLHLLKEILPQSYHMKMKQIPLCSHPTKVNQIQNIWPSFLKVQDFGVIHSETPYREALLQKIECKTDARILRIREFDWLSKIQQLSQCKTLLNIHADPSFEVFETARCISFLDAKVPVVSEISHDLDSRVLWTFNADNLVTKVRLHLLQFENES